MNIYLRNITEHFESVDDQVYTFNTPTDGEIIFEFEINQMNDVKKNLDGDVEEDPEI